MDKLTNTNQKQVGTNLGQKGMFWKYYWKEIERTFWDATNVLDHAKGPLIEWLKGREDLV
jgi:hypothetical protein